MPFQGEKRPDLASSGVLFRPIRPDAGRYTFRPVVKEDLAPAPSLAADSGSHSLVGQTGRAGCVVERRPQ
jgi:hypothetical protein